MTIWFRFHTATLDDPRVQKLDGEQFKAWVNLLCLAGRGEGRLPPIDDIAFALRMSHNDTQSMLERLLNAGLIERRNGGHNGYHYAPSDWDKKQFKSDIYVSRTRRTKHRSLNVSETAPDTETETEKEDTKDPPSLSDSAQARETLPATVFVEDGTPPWRAWVKYRADRGEPPPRPMQTRQGFGRYLPSRWPPGSTARSGKGSS